MRKRPSAACEIEMVQRTRLYANKRQIDSIRGQDRRNIKLEKSVFQHDRFSPEVDEAK